MMLPKGLWFPYACLITFLVATGVYIFTAPDPAVDFPQGDGVELEMEPPLSPPPVTVEQSLELDPQ